MQNNIKPNIFNITDKPRETFPIPKFYTKIIVRYMSEDVHDFEIIETENFNTKLGINASNIGLDEEGIDLEYELKNEDFKLTPKEDEIYHFLWAFNITNTQSDYFNYTEYETEIETIFFKTHKLDQKDIKMLVESNPYLKGYAI